MRRFVTFLTVVAIAVTAGVSLRQAYSKRQQRIIELIEAAGEGDLKKIDELLSIGTDVNGSALDGWTAAAAAASRDQKAAIDKLLSAGANINKGSLTPLYWALARGHLGMAVHVRSLRGKLNLPKHATANNLVHMVRKFSDEELLRLALEIAQSEQLDTSSSVLSERPKL